MFRKLDLFRQDDHRFPIIPSPQEPRNLHSLLYYLRKGVRLTDVALWLDEIQKAGAIAVRDSERGWYGEIAERLRYNAEDFAKGAPRCGPRKARIEQHEQANLPLPPMSVLRAAQVTVQKSKPYEYDSDHDHDPESRRRSQARRDDSGLRSGAEGNGKDSRFAREADAVNDPLWAALHRALGLVEMTQNGALWLKRYKLCRDALATALSDLQSMTPENRARIHPAAYLTTAFENEKRRHAS